MLHPYAETNMQTAAYRATARPPAVTTEGRIAKLEQYLTEMAPFNWTSTYRDAQAELEQLRSEQNTRRRRYRPGRHWLWNAQVYAMRTNGRLVVAQAELAQLRSGGGIWSGEVVR